MSYSLPSEEACSTIWRRDNRPNQVAHEKLFASLSKKKIPWEEMRVYPSTTRVIVEGPSYHCLLYSWQTLFTDYKKIIEGKHN